MIVFLGKFEEYSSAVSAMNVTIKALRYFMTAIERGSLTRAAEELNVVPSAISSAIDQLEREFALTLITRYPSRGIQPTATGRIVAEKARHLLEEYSNLLVAGGELKSALTGTLRIGYYAPVAPAFMPEIAGRLLAGHNAVSLKFFECDNEGAQTGLLNGDYDVIVFVARNVRPGITYEALLSVPPYVLTPHGHPLAKRSTVSPGELADQPLVLLDMTVAGENHQAIMEEAGIAPRIVATATTHEMVRSLVGGGVGCAILNMRPRCAVSYGGDALAAVPLVTEVPALQLVLGFLPGNPRKLVEVFVDECRSYFAGQAAQDLIVVAS